MPLVRLIIFLFRGVGRPFSAAWNFLKALFGAGMRSFLAKSFEVLLRLCFVGSLAATVAVCWNLSDDKPYLQEDHYTAVGPDIRYEISPSAYSRSRRLTPAAMFRDFRPKDPSVPYQQGLLTTSELVEIWNTREMRTNTDQPVSWTSHTDRHPASGSWPKLRETDFAPDDWNPFRRFFEQSWAIITLPLLLALLVFPGSAKLLERIHRACLFTPLCALASFSFAYLFSRHWLSSQHQVMAELFADLPAWTHPIAALNKSIVAGLSLSLIPLALWYLLRWVLGPFLNQSPVRSAP